MRWHGHWPLRWGAVVIGASVLSAAACSHHVPGKATDGHSSAVATTPGTSSAAARGGIGKSPAGVTTRVDVPANSTEEEYYQACHAAKEWMDAQPRTGQSLFEPYLAMVQASPSGTAGSWNARWADLTPARQSAVIVAARAAANDECG